MASSPSTTDHADGDLIFGREPELRRLYELVDRLPERGAALLLRGEAGIGKSALLEAAARRAESVGARVLRTTGVQSEAELPFAGLHHLVLPLLDQVGRLPAPHQKAILAAFGMVETEEAPDRFLISLAVLDLLSEAAESAPLLVVAEDAHWLDDPTARALALVARRIEHEQIGMLLAIREGEASPLDDAGLPELEIGGLDDEAAGELLTAHGHELAPDKRRHVLQTAHGNPLALVELPTLLNEGDLGRGSPLPAPLPLTERLERAFAARVSGLPASTRTLLLVAAADDSGGTLREIIAAAALIEGPELTAQDFLPAIDARLAEIEEERVVFHHPLVRSAVYQSSSLVERRAAHAALAEVLADQPDRQVWHRASALIGRDEGVAAALEAAAERARRRGAISVAISALERAVGLSEDRKRRGQRLLRAAELAFETGHRDLVRRLVAEAEQLDLGAAERHRIAFIREWISEEALVGEAGIRGILGVAERAGQGGDATVARNLLMYAALRCYSTSAEAGIREQVLDASDGLGVPSNDPRMILIRTLVAPLRSGAEVIETLSNLTRGGEGDADASRLLGFAANVVGDYELAAPFLTASVDKLRAQGRIALLAQALVLRAETLLRLDRWDSAASDASEGRHLTEAIGQPAWTMGAVTFEAQLAGLRGEVDRAEELADEAERFLSPLGVSIALAGVRWARGLTALGIGRTEEAYGQLVRAFRPEDPAWHYLARHRLIGDLAEAARYSGHVDEARALMMEIETFAARTGSPAVRVALAHARAMLAEDYEAEEVFVSALGVLSSLPFARARLQLAYGTWLRRRRRVADARAQLLAAGEAFTALGAASWSERARGELRAAGVHDLPREPVSLGDLTPQELRIARLAAFGLSNREIGQQLYLSHRTVGAHLYRIYPKLGITSRAQLRDALD